MLTDIYNILKNILQDINIILYTSNDTAFNEIPKTAQITLLSGYEDNVKKEYDFLLTIYLLDLSWDWVNIEKLIKYITLNLKTLIPPPGGVNGINFTIYDMDSKDGVINFIEFRFTVYLPVDPRESFNFEELIENLKNEIRNNL